jgi:transcriptional regulator with XRE-family HTH domain
MGKAKAENPLLKFGENVRKLREAKGLSLRQLSAMCNLDHSGISKIERGELNITILSILELAKGLEVPPKKLFDLDFKLDD